MSVATNSQLRSSRSARPTLRGPDLEHGEAGRPVGFSPTVTRTTDPFASPVFCSFQPSSRSRTAGPRRRRLCSYQPSARAFSRPAPASLSFSGAPCTPRAASSGIRQGRGRTVRPQVAQFSDGPVSLSGLGQNGQRRISSKSTGPNYAPMQTPSHTALRYALCRDGRHTPPWLPLPRCRQAS